MVAGDDAVSAASERLPSERCPRCDTLRRPLLWSIDTVGAQVRAYRCVDCGATWSVDGRQESLFDVGDLAQDAGGGEVMPLALD
jgi:hypothetical protein